MEIEMLLELRKLSMDTLKQKYKLTDSDITENVSYQKVKGLTVANKPGVLPGVFYYAGNTVTMIYFGEEVVPDNISVSKIFKVYGEGKALKSRAGKTSLMHVYPELGFAFSMHGGTIEFMEIFPSMSIKEYKKNVYEEVFFIR